MLLKLNILMRKAAAIIFLAFLMLVYSLNAWAERSDSLKTLIQNGRDDTLKVNNLLELSKTYFSTAPQDAITYAQQAKTLAEKLQFRKGEAYALKNIGIGYYQQAQYVEAINVWQRSLEVFDSIGDKVGVSNILNNQGSVYFNQGDEAKALELYLKSLKIAEDIHDTLRIVTALYNIGAVYSNKPATYDKALEYYKRALPLSIELKDNYSIGTVTVNLGEIYFNKDDDDTALKYFKESLEAYKGSENVPYSLNDIGRVYLKRGDYATALKYHQQAFDIAKNLDAKLDMTQSLLGLGKTNMEKGDIHLALKNYKDAETMANTSGFKYELKDSYEGLALAYAKLKDYGDAFSYQALLIAIKDTLYNIETDKKLGGLSFAFEIQKKQSQIDLLTKDKALQDLDLKRQKLVINASLAGLFLIIIIAVIIYRNYRQKVKTNKILDKQKAEIENLLLNILPAQVAAELQREGHATSRFYDNVSVLFTDFKGFTKLAEGLTPNQLVAELNDFFVAFDEIIGKYNLEKIKTIGDSYMCAGGIPIEDHTHPIDIVKAGLEIQQFIKTKNEKKLEQGLNTWDLRVGIHTGPVVAGVVGKKKYAYDIWGDTVNIASRMESSGEIGKVNISGATYELVKDNFECVYRGKIEAKNKGVIDMYFVNAVNGQHQTA